METRLQILLGILAVMIGIAIWRGPEIIKKYKRLSEGLPPSRARKKVIEYKEVEVAVEWKAQNPDTPAAELEKLAQSEDGYICQLVARHPNTPLNVLQKLAEMGDMFISQEVISNPNVTPEILTFLANAKDTFIRRLVARHAHTPEAILKTLAQDENQIVRWEVSRSPNTTSEIFSLITPHVKQPYVKQGLACNSNTPAEVLKQVAHQPGDPDWWCWWCISENPNASEDLKHEVKLKLIASEEITAVVLENLAADSNEEISNQAKNILGD